MRDDQIPHLTDAAIDAINSEIDYQNALGHDRHDGIDHGVEGQIVTLERYTRKVIDAWTDNATEEQSLHELRKVAAIACRAMMLYGAYHRDPLDILPVNPSELRS